MSTAQASEYWRTRDASYGTGWTEHYWESKDAPYRYELHDVLTGVRGARSFFEVGCNVGANLERLVGRGGDVGGCDVNVAAVMFATSRIHGVFHAGSLLETLSVYLRGSWDVVFSCYALAYIAPSDLPQAVRSMMRVARKAIVLAEPMQLDGAVGYEVLNGIPEYKHDYVGVLHAFGVPRHRLSIRRIEAPDHLNAILTLEVA